MFLLLRFQVVVYTLESIGYGVRTWCQYCHLAAVWFEYCHIAPVWCEYCHLAAVLLDSSLVLVYLVVFLPSALPLLLLIVIRARRSAVVSCHCKQMIDRIHYDNMPMQNTAIFHGWFIFSNEKL